MRFRVGRVLGYSMLFGGVFGMSVGLLSVGSAGASSRAAMLSQNDNAFINPGNVPADSTTYNPGDDCGTGPSATAVGWYFVLPPGTANGADTFVSLDVVFQSGEQDNVTFTNPGGKLDKAVVFTAGDDVLLDAGAVVSPSPDPSPAQFVLSHVCNGGNGEGSSSSSSSSSTSGSSSSVEGSSTTNTTASSSDGTAVLGEELARTGSSHTGQWTAAGLALVLGGAGLLLLSRRRNAAS